MVLTCVTEASRHLSQLVNRNNSTPIPIDIYEKADKAGNGSAASLNTG